MTDDGLKTCPGCTARINYDPPCEICRRKISQEYDERRPEPGEKRGLNPIDPRFFNIPGQTEPYQP